jgi:phosphopantothenoylcysteine decarboxylase/phosphopantothenate--cysteine ligase
MKFLISAGPTRERIDPVRFISNRSSGKMGYALAEAAINAGHEVILISGPVSLTPPQSVKLLMIESATEMSRKIRIFAKQVDIIIMAAAVADYRPVSPSIKKIKKTKAPLTLQLERTEDILATLGNSRNGDSRLIVGFAAETENILSNAHAKLKRKNLDWIIANDVSRSDAGFASNSNEVTMISKDGRKITIPLMDKKSLARKIIDNITIRQNEA